MKSQKLQLPDAPTFQTDPTAAAGIPDLLKYGQELASGDFGGRLSWLNPTINNNNSALALAAAQGTLQPQFRDTLQQITNAAAANGQLNSSTFTDALARSQSDLNSQYQSIVSQQAINDSNQSNANRISLFGTGLNTINTASGLGLQNQSQKNQFNLENYSNLVANAIQNNQNANKANGWQQVLGMVSPMGHDYLQSQGVTSVPGYGVADMAQIASMFIGMGGGKTGGFGNVNGIGGQTNPFGGGLRTGQIAPSAGSYASNNPFMNSSPYSPNYLYN